MFSRWIITFLFPHNFNLKKTKPTSARMSDLPPVPKFNDNPPPKNRMNVRLRFLRALFKGLLHHLHLGTLIRNTTSGPRLYITPWDNHTMMKIRLTLSWVEGHRVLYLGDCQILLLFKYYCRKWYPNYYNLRFQGYGNIILN